MEVQKIAIDTDTIQLDQFLKWAGVTTTGGDIRTLLDNRQIKRNGETVTTKITLVFE